MSGTPLHVRDGNLATLMAEQGCRISSVEGVEPRGIGADELAASTRRLENIFSPGRTWPDGAAMHSYEVTELFARPADGCSCLLDVQCSKAFNETNWPGDSLHKKSHDADVTCPWLLAWCEASCFVTVCRLSENRKVQVMFGLLQKDTSRKFLSKVYSI